MSPNAIMAVQLLVNALLVGLVLYRDWRWKIDRDGTAIACRRIAKDELALAETFLDDGRRRYHAGRSSAFAAVAALLEGKGDAQ